MKERGYAGNTREPVWHRKYNKTEISLFCFCTHTKRLFYDYIIYTPILFFRCFLFSRFFCND